MATILLVRHGETDWNHERRAQGQADIDLNDQGRRQAAHAAAELAGRDIAAVYSSDSKRALDTATAIAAPLGLPVIADPRFREIASGEWEGLLVDEIKARWPDLWGPARHYSRRPGGESPPEVRTRALAGVRAAVKAHPDSAIVIVSHGGTIRWISAEALGYDDRRSARIRGLGNGSIVTIEAVIEDGALRLSGLVRMDGSTPDLDDPND